MKTFTTLLMAVILSVMVTAQDYEMISLKEVKEIANRNAKAQWGEVFPNEPIAYYGFDGEIIAWRINYSIGKPFPSVRDLKAERKTSRENGDKLSQWGSGKFGRLLISARSNMPVILERSKSLSPEYAEILKLERMKKTAFGSQDAVLKKVWYFNHFNTWYEFHANDQIRYINISPTGGILDEKEFKEERSKAGHFVETADFSEEWSKYRKGFSPGGKDIIMIPAHGVMPFYDWSYGCTPTAGAMLLAYWDYLSLLTDEDNYSGFVSYHYQRYDTIDSEDRESHWDYNVPNLQKMLALAMDTDTISGTTWPHNMDDGYAHVCNSMLDYDFEIEGRYTMHWTLTTGEIDAGRPIHIDISGHSVCGVGYDPDENLVITRYTWDPVYTAISRWSMLHMVLVKPGGPRGVAVSLAEPFGDRRYNRTGNGELLHGNDYFEIKWYADKYLNDTWAQIAYSTNGGHHWEEIVANTPNIGYYNWHVPDGIDSEECRVQVIIHDPLCEPRSAGVDGSYGNFEIQSGGSVSFLPHESIRSTDTRTKYYNLQHNHNSWGAVGAISSDPEVTWTCDLWDDEFDASLVESYFDHAQNLVVFDRNHLTEEFYGIKTRPLNGDTTVYIQFDGHDESLELMPGAELQINWPNNRIIKMYDVHLDPGQYYFRVRPIGTGPKVDIAFFSSGDGEYFKSIFDADYISENTGSADDSFVVTIDEEDDYGFCIFSSERGAGIVSIKLEEAFIWRGTVDNDWHNPENWSGGSVPTSSNDVVIPDVTNPPNIYTGAANCNKLDLLEGAELTITNYNLQVSGQASIGGHLHMPGPSAILSCYDDISVGASGHFDLHENAKIDAYKNWTFESGSHANFDDGKVQFMGSENSIIYVKSGNVWFHSLHIYKSSGAFVAYDNCPGLQPLRIKGQFIIGNGAQFIQWALYNTIFEGPFLAYSGSSFGFVNGTAIFDYDGSGGIAVNSEPGSYFNDVVVSCTNFLDLSGDIEIRGDLTIEEGNFRTMGHDVYIQGDWNDEAWGFNHGNSRVIFNGTGIQESYGGAFWELELDKPSGELRIRENTTGVQHYDWTQGTVRVNGGYFYVADLEDDGLYGGIILTEGNIEIQQDPGQFFDMNADLEISGGEMEISGGNGIGFWPYSNDASITMSDGVLDIKDNGIRIHNSINYNFETNITGGTIRINGDLGIYRDDFHPAGGTIFMYGYDEDSEIYGLSTASLHNLTVHKSSSKAIKKTLVASGTLDINGDFVLEDGVFSAPPVMKIYGQFINNQSGSSFHEMEGTVIFDGPEENTISDNATFYNLTIQKPSGYFIVNEGVSIDIKNTLTVDEGLMGFLAGCDLSLGEALAVNSGGTIIFEGQELDRINVNSAVDKGNYTFDVNSGGTFGAGYTTFIYMDMEGINLHSGSYIIPEGAFYHCNFAHGLPGGTLLTIDNGADIVIHDAYFLTNTTGMAHNVTKNVDNGSVQFDEAIGDFSGPDFENDPYNRIHWEYIPPFDLPFAENWDSEDFETNNWTPTGDNWIVDAYNGNDAPSAAFRFTPSITNYSQHLRSYQISGVGHDWINLSYDIAYDEYLSGTLEQLSVRVVYPNGDFYTVANYTNDSGSFGYSSEEIDISAYAAGEIFQVSFVAHGENSYNINNWNIDNILVEEYVPEPGTLKGTVTGPDGKGVIEGAYVQILNTPFETFTNSEGSYILENIPPDFYSVQVSANGYQNENKGVEVASGITVVMNFGLTPLPPEYCSENLYETGCLEGDGINSFFLEDIENEDSGCSEGGYGDFTDMSTDLSIGGFYPLKVSSNYGNQYVSVWIDLQDDYTFSPFELFVEDYVVPTAGELVEIPFEIPDTLGAGTHRLRIRSNWNASSSDPCATYTYGEVEDYTVNLVDTAALSGLTIFVSDSLTKAPIENAYVEVVGTNWFGYTEDEGYCFISGMESGIYDVLVMAEGFEDLLLPDQNLYANQTLAVSCELTSAEPETHTIQLQQGWQGLSSYLMPQDNTIANIFQPILPQLTLVHNFEAFFWPDAGIYSLNMWEHHDGFFIRVKEDVTLNIQGFPETDQICEVPESWSILPVLSRGAILLESLLDGTTALENIVIIKEIANTGIFWPQYGIHTLNALEPGKSYLICMAQEDAIVFPEIPDKQEIISERWDYPDVVDWNKPCKTPVSHIVMFPESVLPPMISPGCLLAAFTPEGICAGLIPATGNSCITIFGDDPATFEKEGYSIGDPLHFAILNPLTMEQKDLDVDFDPAFQSFNGKFENNGISMVLAAHFNPNQIMRPWTSQIEMYPNPTDGKVIISGFNEKGEITVLDAGGQVLLQGDISEDKQYLDLSSLQKGVYLVRIQTKSSTISKRIIRL